MDKLQPHRGDDIELELDAVRVLLNQAHQLGIDLKELTVDDMPATAKFSSEVVNVVKEYLLKNGHYKSSEAAALVIRSATCAKKPEIYHEGDPMVDGQLN